MTAVPGTLTVSKSQRKVLQDLIGYERGDDAVLDKDNCVDAANTSKTWEIRAGVVIGKTSGNKWVNAANTSTGAENSNVVESTQASVSASETADSDWQSATITVTINGVDIVTVTLGGADDTDAEVVTALNGDGAFRANCIADVSSSRVRIQTLRRGAEVHLKVTSSLTTAFGASGTSAYGTDGDYIVMLETAQVQDENGSAVDAMAGVTARRGHFDESQLLGLTEDAKAVLTKRGSKFS